MNDRFEIDAEIARATRAVYPEAKKPYLVAERELELMAGNKCVLTLDLRVYGIYHPASKGYTPRGERQLTPDEDSFVDIDRITLADLRGEVDITAIVNGIAYDEIQDWATEVAEDE